MRHSLRPLRAATAVKLSPGRFKIGLAVFVATTSLVCACASRKSADVPEAAPSAAAVSPAQQLSQTPPARIDEVKEAVNRIFKEAALPDASRNPNFLAGDFNGDRSQDIAVILKPAPGKLSQMNQDFPPWILRDPFISAQPGMPPLCIAATDVLLAVIHGYGANGWRDPQATQTYLLKNVVGSNVKTFSKSDVMAANQGKNLPRLLGDSIGEVLHGRSGYLYYAEATYSWYDPQTFTGDPERSLIHPGATVRSDQSDLLNIKSKRGIAVEK